MSDMAPVPLRPTAGTVPRRLERFSIVLSCRDKPCPYTVNPTETAPGLRVPVKS